VIACRSAEYAEMPNRLRLYSAIRLRPLTPEQIDEYLARQGPKLEVLRASLKSQPDGYALASTPLMLTMMCVAFQDAPTGGVDLGAPAGRFHDRLFGAFVAKMFRRKNVAAPRQSEVLRTLSWTARQMRDHSSTLFAFERMQPAWLGSRAAVAVYAVVAASVVVAVPALILLMVLSIDTLAGIDAGIDTPGLLEMIACFAAACILVDVLRLALVQQPKQEAGAALRALPIAYAAGYGGIALFCLVATSRSDDALITFFTFGALWCIGYGSQSIRRDASDDIAMGHDARWSWSRAGLGAIVGIVVGGVCEEVVDTSFKIFETVTVREVLTHMQRWAMSAFTQPVRFAADFVDGPDTLVYALAGAALLGVRPAVRARILSTNQGLLASSKRFVLVFVVVLIVSLAGQMRANSESSFADAVREVLERLPLLTYIVVVFSLPFGGIDVIRHLVLRAMLAARRDLPIPAVPLLDEATSLVFLRRVGGAYVFMHRLLLEYFATAALAPPRREQAVGPSP